MSSDFKTITDEFSVAPQLQPEDLQAAAAAGFKSVIINRPDFELEPTQSDSATMIAAAEKAGLQVRYQPVVASQISLEDVLEFKQNYTDLPKPVLAYCRSGGRCANLYQLAQQQD